MQEAVLVLTTPTSSSKKSTVVPTYSTKPSNYSYSSLFVLPIITIKCAKQIFKNAHRKEVDFGRKKKRRAITANLATI